MKKETLEQAIKIKNEIHQLKNKLREIELSRSGSFWSGHNSIDNYELVTCIKDDWSYFKQIAIKSIQLRIVELEKELEDL